MNQTVVKQNNRDGHTHCFCNIKRIMAA